MRLSVFIVIGALLLSSASFSYPWEPIGQGEPSSRPPSLPKDVKDNTPDGVPVSGTGFIGTRDPDGDGMSRFTITSGPITVVLDAVRIGYVLSDGEMGYLVTVHLTGSTGVGPLGVGPRDHTTNHIIGNEPADWTRGARSFNSVEYRDIYPGIDMRFDTTGDQVKYEFTVGPGSDPSAIRLRVEGHTSLDVTEDGDLSISTPLGDIVDRHLVAVYADGDGEEVPCSFDLVDGDTYGFDLGPRDTSRTLVLDPLIYTTLLGGSTMDEPADVAVDVNGNSYIVGTTASTDLPTTPGVLQPMKSNDTDAFVSMVDSSGSTLVWTTYFGGEGYDEATGIALDPDGSLVITGTTNSTDFPTSSGVLSPSYQGGHCDAFVLMLHHNGSALEGSTYVGGSGGDKSYDIDVGVDGLIYFVGETWSDDYPLVGAYQERFWYRNVFVSVLQANMARMTYSTYFGRSRETVGTCIAVNGLGHAYIAGYTEDGNLPVKNAIQGGMTWVGWDVWYAAFDPSKYSEDSLLMMSYWGSYEADYAYGIDVDDDGTYVITGTSEGIGLTGSQDIFQNKSKGGYDVFVYSYWGQKYGRWAPEGFLTYLGGEGDEEARSVRFDRNGDIHLTGTTTSSDFPTTDLASLRDYSGNGDAFYTLLDTNGTHLEHSTYLGGGREDAGAGLALNERTNVTVVGSTKSQAFPTTEGAFQVTHAGGMDGFVTSLSMAMEPPVVVLGPDLTVEVHEMVVLDGSACTDDVGIVNWTWFFQYGTETKLLYGPTTTFSFGLMGEYQVNLAVTDVDDRTATGSFNITVEDLTPPTANAGDAQTIGQGDEAILDGSRSRDNVIIVDYQWTFEYDGEVLTIPGAKNWFTFERPGVFEITLTVTDGVGLTGTDILMVTVNDTEPPPPPTVPASPIYTNEPIFQLAGQGEPGGRLQVLAGPDLVATAAIDGEGEWTVDLTLDSIETTVRFRVVDGAGNVGDATSDLLIVLDTEPPQADAGEAQVEKVGRAVTMDGSGSSDGYDIGRYEWTFTVDGNPVTLEGEIVTHTFEDPGIVEVTLTVTDLAGNTDTDTTVVSVRPENEPPVLTGGELRPAKGDTDTRFTFTVIFTDADGDLGEVWVVIDGESHQMTAEPDEDTSDGQNFSYKTKLKKGKHTYRFIGEDSQGNTGGWPSLDGNNSQTTPDVKEAKGTPTVGAGMVVLGVLVAAVIGQVLGRKRQ